MARPDHDPMEAYSDVLQEMVRQGLSLATMLHDGAREAETPADTAVLSKSWHQITRNVRQTMALHSRLRRESQAYIREFGPQIARDHAEKVCRRRTEVHREVAEVIWTEKEKPEDTDYMLGELFEVLDHESRQPAFLDEPVDVQIARIRHMLALDEHARRDIAQMPDAPDRDEPAPPNSS